MIPNRTFQWTNDQSWKYRAEIEVIVNKWLIVILMMGHSRDQSLDGNVRNQTLIDCSCDLNWSQNNNPEEQIQELWSSNSIRENENQVFWFYVCLNIRIWQMTIVLGGRVRKYPADKWSTGGSLGSSILLKTNPSDLCK